MGVRNAILRIISELNHSDDQILVIGPLIHNPQTISILQKRGLLTIKDGEDIQNRTVAIRTHGIPINQLRDIKKQSRRFINLTCPRVAKVQGIIKKHSERGYFTLIIGDDDHAEVIGLKSYASSGVFVLSRPEEIQKIPVSDRYIVVSQTTFDKNVFSEIVDRIERDLKRDDLLIFNTICNSTDNRQEDVREAICRGIDALIVVGGKNSANTRRLSDIGKEAGVKTYHIETEDDLREDDFKGIQYILVTAGASTPGWIINNVLEKLYDIKFKNSSMIINLLKKSVEFITRANILSAISAFFLSLFVNKYASGNTDYVISAIATFFIFSMYTLNNYFLIGSLKESNPNKLSLYQKFRKVLLPLSLILLALSLVLIMRYRWETIALFSFSLFMGLTYSTSWMKNLIMRIPSPALIKLYNAKNLATSLGWVIICAALPFSHYGGSIPAITAVTFLIFTIVFSRNIILDLVAFQGDLIIGRETLPILIGTSRMKILLIQLNIIAAAVFTSMTVVNQQWQYLWMLIILMNFIVILRWITRQNYLIALKYELLVDLNLFLLIVLYFVTDLIHQLL